MIEAAERSTREHWLLSIQIPTLGPSYRDGPLCFSENLEESSTILQSEFRETAWKHPNGESGNQVYSDNLVCRESALP